MTHENLKKAGGAGGNTYRRRPEWMRPEWMRPKWMRMLGHLTGLPQALQSRHYKQIFHAHL